MTKEETEYVYRSVKNGTQVKPVHTDKIIHKIVDVSVNPYQEALTQELDSHLHEEPSLEMKRCDLTWSILSTEIDYTTNKDNSPYREMNTSNLYNRLQGDEQLIMESSSDQWDEKFEEVTCSLHYTHKFDDTNDVIPLIWEVTWLRMNQELSQWIITFPLMEEECQKHISQMGHP